MPKISESSSEIKSVLIYVGLDLLGDGLMKLPFVRALRSAFPEARIVWLAGKGKSVYGGLLSPLVNGLIDEVVDEAGVGLRWSELFREPLAGTPLEGQTFDLVIDTQRRLRPTLILRRIPHKLFLSGTLGQVFSDRRAGRGRAKPLALAAQLLQLVELASRRPSDTHYPLTLDPELTACADALLPSGPVTIGLAPGAGLRHKCWPLERFVALARAEREKGRRVVLLLGPGEAEWYEDLTAQLPDALFPLQDPRAAPHGEPALLAIALGQRLSAAVANDAGFGHVLAAANCPLVSLFGPTSPDKFAPRVEPLRIVKAQSFGNGPEMSNIPVEAVGRSIDELLSPALDQNS